MRFDDKGTKNTENQLRLVALSETAKVSSGKKGKKDNQTVLPLLLSYPVICRRHSGNGDGGWPN